MSDNLKCTALHTIYKDYGAKVIDFGGWSLPVQFSGIVEEHLAVRENAGLFDVSHMGEVEVKGPNALKFIQKIITNDASKLVDGKALYSPMCYLDGGTVDDLLVYRFSEKHYLLVINASNIEKDIEWFNENLINDVEIKNLSDQMSLLAIQGPKAEKILQKITNTDLKEIGSYNFIPDVDLAGIKGLVSRTGYTGEDGFEIYLANNDAIKLWRKILEVGEQEGIVPCGLGARDTLRLEAKLPLYGQELSKDITPIEGGIGFFVKLDKENFNGRERLALQKEQGAERKIVGIEMIDRGIPRSHYPVYVNDEIIGEITTGTFSPTLKKNLGLALIKKEHANIDGVVYVGIRNKRIKAKIIKTPFYKRKK